jgi:DNA-binding Xre family transcriptional regulator
MEKKELEALISEVEEESKYELNQMKILKDKLDKLHSELLSEGNTYAAGYLCVDIDRIQQSIENHTDHIVNDKWEIDIHKVGKRIKEERKKRGINQKALAESVGTSIAYISNIEEGKQNILTIKMLDRIATALNVCTVSLLCKTTINREGPINELPELQIHKMTNENR